jgi:RNA polymerase sigma-70 factor (ECF subfamily)
LASLPATDDRIAAASRGDRAAAQALCKELLPRVRNLVRYLVRGDSLVDDIAQEGLIAVLRGLSSYRGEGRFEAWVDRIVARTAFATLRRVRSRPEDARELPADAASDDPSGEQYVLRRQVAALLDGLPAEQREAVALHFATGMTVPEIAELTGAPQETVRSRIRLGKAALRAALGGRDAES